MKKVCIVTAARSEYGLLRWVIDEVYHSSELDLQLIVTGGHLSEEQGYTYKSIEADGYPIAAKLDIKIDSSNQKSICKSMALCQELLSETLCQLKPDVLVVLGDRYELLPICSTALMLNIPIAHIAGGDITEGALDNSVRNAVTMMSTYHFPGTEESCQRVKRMIGSDYNVFVTGETNLDNFNRLERWSKQQLAESLNLNTKKKWVICTYHSETLLTIEENLERVKALCKLFTEELKDYEVVITKSNADFGGTIINQYFESVAQFQPHIHVFSSLGQLRYISMLYNVEFMIGNSSSGIFESPVVPVPCITLGERQKGRLYTPNILQVNGDYNSIQTAYHTTLSPHFKDSLNNIQNPYGDGHSSERIVSIIKEKLYV